MLRIVDIDVIVLAIAGFSQIIPSSELWVLMGTDQNHYYLVTDIVADLGTTLYNLMGTMGGHPFYLFFC